jgi:UDP-glucose/iron transport system permease protein
VGLVTLPGAFVGVLLGGGTPIQAGAAQVLVLLGLLAAETVTVVVAYQLMKASRLLPPDLRSRLVA